MNRGIIGVSSLPKTVTRQHRDCDLNPGPSVPEPEPQCHEYNLNIQEEIS